MIFNICNPKRGTRLSCSKKMPFLLFMFTILCLAKYVVPRTGGATVPHFVTACPWANDTAPKLFKITLYLIY